MPASAAERRTSEEAQRPRERPREAETPLTGEALHLRAPEMIRGIENKAAEEQAAVAKLLEQDMINRNLDEVAKGQVALLAKKEKTLFGGFMKKVKQIGSDLADLVRGRELRQMTEVSDTKKAELVSAKTRRAIDEFLVTKPGVDVKVINTRRQVEDSRQQSRVKIDEFAKQKGAGMDIKVLHDDTQKILDTQKAGLAFTNAFLEGKPGVDEKVLNQSPQAVEERSKLRQEARQEKEALVYANRREIDKNLAGKPNVDKPIIPLNRRLDKFLENVKGADTTIRNKEKISFDYIENTLPRLVKDIELMQLELRQRKDPNREALLNNLMKQRVGLQTELAERWPARADFIKRKVDKVVTEVKRIAQEQRRKEREPRPELPWPTTRHEIQQRLELDKEQRCSAIDFFETVLENFKSTNELKIKKIKEEMITVMKVANEDNRRVNQESEELVQKATLGTITMEERPKLAAAFEAKARVGFRKQEFQNVYKEQIKSLEAPLEKITQILSDLGKNDVTPAYAYLSEMQRKIWKSIDATDDLTLKEQLENNEYRIQRMMENLDLEQSLLTAPEDNATDLPSEPTIVTPPPVMEFPSLAAQSDAPAPKPARRNGKPKTPAEAAAN